VIDHRKSWTTARLLLILLIVFSATPSMAAEYAYPIPSAVEATIISTPPEYQTKLPEHIQVKEYQTITIFPERKVPEVFWYNRELRYSVAYHDQQAPLIFVIAGTGAGYDSAKMKLLQRAFFQDGFHVICLSSPTHPNFIVAASSSGLPGDSRRDAADLYQVMEKIWQQVKHQNRVTKFLLAGYSLGGAEAAFVAQLDEEKKVFNFEKVLMLNPPVSIYDSAVRIDHMLTDNIPGGLDHFNEFYNRLMHRITSNYARGDFVDLSYEFFLHTYDKVLPDPNEGKAVIGLAFRISLANMLFASDVVTNAGYIVPKNLILFKTDSLTNYYKVACQCSFADYARDLLYATARKQEPGLSFQEFIARNSLKAITDYLHQSPKIGLVTNADDIILESKDIDWFKEVFGSRARIWPRGGHCGNLAYPDNVAYMIDFFKE
jgi:pimeloyl-ACP methyl ester carboxylesterase